jgi:hypothetical protein
MRSEGIHSAGEHSDDSHHDGDRPRRKESWRGVGYLCIPAWADVRAERYALEATVRTVCALGAHALDFIAVAIESGRTSV